MAACGSGDRVDRLLRSVFGLDRKLAGKMAAPENSPEPYRKMTGEMAGDDDR